MPWMSASQTDALMHSHTHAMTERVSRLVHAMDERISDWCDALKAALPKGEADNVNKLSVGDAAQVRGA
eukprot:1160106-Pelagomonas_calceolata.AAC.4